MGARWAIPMAARIVPMTSDPALILTQWLSPSYPVGAFAWSHGLEQAIADGAVADAGQLHDWLAAILTHGTGRSDAILLCAACRGEAVADLAQALAASRERRLESLQQGAAFATITRAVWGLDLPDAADPVGVGRAARLMGLPAQVTARVYLFGFISNLVQAAQRLMPLGQTRGQILLAALAPLCDTIGTEAAGASVDDIGTATFAADIASMRHDTLEPRIFRS